MSSTVLHCSFSLTVQTHEWHLQQVLTTVCEAMHQCMRLYLKRAQDAVHGDKVHLHHDPLLFAQVALDLVQHTAAIKLVNGGLHVLYACADGT